jgi:hypothetical protein
MIKSIKIVYTVTHDDGKVLERTIRVDLENTKFSLEEVHRLNQEFFDSIKLNTDYSNYLERALAMINPGTSMPVPEPTGQIYDRETFTPAPR